jgi:hypothetical protein
MYGDISQVEKGVFLTRGHSPLTIRPMIAKQLTPELGEKKQAKPIGFSQANGCGAQRRSIEP